MKKILLLLFVSLFAVSCVDKSNDLPEDFPDSGWIQLSNNAPDEVPASIGTFNIPFSLAIGNNASGQTITYNVSLASGGPVAGLPLGDFSFNLVKGEKSGMFSIPVVNDGSSYELDVTLVSTSNLEYTIGLSDNTKKITHRIKVCKFTTNWEGTYSVSEAFYAGANQGLSLGAVFGESYQMELVTDTSDASGTSFLLSNSSGFNAFFDNGNHKLTLDACSEKVLFDDATPRIALWQTMTIEEAVFNGATNTISVKGPYGPFGPYRFVLTKM